MNKIISSNEDLLNTLVGIHTLLDGSIESLEIRKRNDAVDIIVFVSLIRPGNKRFAKLFFKDILEYDFSWSSEYFFYYIERYNFFKSEKGFYISFDPYDDNKEISLKDHDYILSGEVIGELDI